MATDGCMGWTASADGSTRHAERNGEDQMEGVNEGREGGG